MEGHTEKATEIHGGIARKVDLLHIEKKKLEDLDLDFLKLKLL